MHVLDNKEIVTSLLIVLYLRDKLPDLWFL